MITRPITKPGEFLKQLKCSTMPYIDEILVQQLFYLLFGRWVLSFQTAVSKREMYKFAAESEQ